MAKKPTTPAARIAAEKKALMQTFADVPKDYQDIVDRLTDRAAWLKITLEDLEASIDKHGNVMEMQSSPNLPKYLKANPEVRQCQQYNGQYLRIMQELRRMMPKPKTAKELADEEEDRQFEAFARHYGVDI